MRSFLIVLSFMVGVITARAVMAGDEVAGVKLQAAAAPDKPEILLGEPGYLTFRVSNPTDRALLIMVGGDYRNRLGRPNSFTVELVGADGKRVAQPDAGFDFGGRTAPHKLPARGDYVFSLFLPHWATFEKPGRYTVTIRRKVEVVADDGTDAFRQKPITVEVTATTTLTVEPADPVKLGRIIAHLGPKMLDRRSPDAERAEQMLQGMHDERVVPYFIALAQQPHPSPRYAACEVLGSYKSDEAFAALQKLAKTTGAELRDSATTLELAESSADGVRHAAVHAIGVSPHPKAIALLWTFAGDRYEGVRLTVLHRAAELKTPEARAIIKQMTCDKEERVRNEAQRYLKQLGQ
jgi:HEAT repeats